MPNDRPQERCCECGKETGKAGLGDGSLYCRCSAGPFCGECFGKHAAMHDDDEYEEYREVGGERSNVDGP